jgi:NADPH-dependent 2,4-dienoyl-CoA reductase/sulfur reductase-like enzyme/rhodanese-related sulfurtransferase
MKKVVMVGGMAAGCKAAARLKRLNPDHQVTIIEKKPFVSFGTCGMPFFASGDIDDFSELMSTPYGLVRDAEFFKESKGIDVLINSEVIRIDTEKKIISYKNLISGEFTDIEYDELVIGTGAAPLSPRFPCPESDKISTFHNPLDAKYFRQKAQTGKIGKAIVIGGGYIGCELAEALVSLWGIETTLIELENNLLPRCMDEDIAKLLETVFTKEDIELKLSTKVEKIELDDEGSPIVYTNDGWDSGAADHVFLCMGIKPSIALAESIGVKIGEQGGIVVNEHLQTNIPNVWAAGDCIETINLITSKPSLFPLGSLANRQGRVIADNIAGRTSKFKGAIGTISMKAFGLITASAGLTEKDAKRSGFDTGAVTATFYDRPDYHPDNKNLFGKLVYDKKNMRLLGLQLAGYGEVTRYIDSFSVFASNGMTCYDLIDFEHAYTPPHSGPMNPLNSLGAMAISQEEGIACISFIEAANFDGQIIDVREEAEVNAYSYSEKAKCYSIMEYKKHIDEFDKEKPLLVVCQKGPRSYEAAMTFIQNGFKDVKYIGGGVQMAQQLLEEGEI